MAKHFSLTITDSSFSYARREEKIAAEASIDGIYVVRTSSQEVGLEAADIVERYKSLSLVENAFRSIKTVDLKVRPIHHRNADRVRSHVLLCMLAYYVEWHMRSVLKPVLFDDEEPASTRPDPVAPKKPSRSAKAKARTKRTPDALPVHSFQSLLADLATITRNTIVPLIPGAPSWDQNTEPTQLQKKILDLLNSLPNR